MKIVKKGYYPKTPEMKVICERCGTELLITDKDVERYYGLIFSKYFYICENCSHHNYIPKDSPVLTYSPR